MNNGNKSVLIVKALEDGVTVLFNRQDDSPSQVPERLDKGEVFIIATPERGDGIRIRGIAEVYTPDHMVKSESGLIIGGGQANRKE